MNNSNACLFISHSKRGKYYYHDASARYRCVFPALHMQSRGHITHTIHFNDINKVSLQDYQTFIFHRPIYSQKLKQLITALRQKNKRIIADFDDLLFKPELATELPSVINEPSTLKSALKSAQKYRKALLLFDECWTSTDALKKHAQDVKSGLTVSTCYNKVPSYWPDLYKTTPEHERLKQKVISYFPGTRYHEDNFSLIAQELAIFLKDNPDCLLQIIGDIRINQELFPTGQLIQKPPVSYESLPEYIANSWVVLAPLIGNAFNSTKSALKFWESGLFSIPVIATVNQDFERFQCRGLIPIDTSRQWLKHLTALKNDEAYTKACRASKVQGQKSVFCHSQQDTREAYLGLTTNKDVTKDNPVYTNYLQAMNPLNNEIMTFLFSSNWPAILTNPTEGQHKRTLEVVLKMKGGLIIDDFKEKSIKEFYKNISSPKELSNALKVKNNNAYRSERKSDTPMLRRKFRKLVSNPKLFFKDALKKIIKKL